MIRFILIVSSLFVLTGCISNGTPKPSVSIGRAVVFTNSSIINFPKANIAIRKIDDKVVSTYFTLSPPTKVTLDAGEHSFIVAFYSSGYAGKAYVKGLLKENHIYEIYAYSNSENMFDVKFADVTFNQQKILDSVKVQGYYKP